MTRTSTHTAPGIHPGPRALTVPAWLAAPFRPFFLGAAALGALAVPLWLAMLFGFLDLPTALPPLQWHVHEMLFGVVGAAAAGFLLTAVSVWTSTPAVVGPTLYVLFALWLSARLLMLSGASLPPWAASLPDCLFFAGTAALLARRTWRARQWRQLPLVAGLAVLCLAAWWFPRAGALDRGAVILAADAIVVLMVVIGGRITPAFARNWLRLHGREMNRTQDPPALQYLTLLGALALLLSDVLGLIPVISTSLAALTAFSLAQRLVLWHPWSIRREPLLWILHLGLGWVVIALLLRVASVIAGLPDTLWLHALGAGAMATLILGVMTRVSLGHTGRDLVLPRGAIACYLAITAAALVRVLVAAGWLPYLGGLILAGACWTLAFVLFLVYYIPVLTRPRVDGRPG